MPLHLTLFDVKAFFLFYLHSVDSKFFVDISLYECVYNGGEGDKEYDTDNTEEVASDNSRGKSPQGAEANGATHHVGIDKLIFHKLNHHINYNASDNLRR